MSGCDCDPYDGDHAGTCSIYVQKPVAEAHRHVWKECAPGTVGAGAARVCVCGMYDVDPMPWEGDPAYYEKAADRARTLRLLYQQGYTEVETATARAGERECTDPPCAVIETTLEWWRCTTHKAGYPRTPAGEPGTLSPNTKGDR